MGFFSFLYKLRFWWTWRHTLWCDMFLLCFSRTFPEWPSPGTWALFIRPCPQRWPLLDIWPVEQNCQWFVCESRHGAEKFRHVATLRRRCFQRRRVRLLPWQRGRWAEFNLAANWLMLVFCFLVFLLNVFYQTSLVFTAMISMRLLSSSKKQLLLQWLKNS